MSVKVRPTGDESQRKRKKEGGTAINQTIENARRILWGAGTARTLRVHWMLHELKLDYETRAIRSRTGETQTAEFTRLNPRQKIPLLQDGSITLAESGAIVTYLAERYGQPTGLIPPPLSPERAAYLEWCFFTMMELDAHTLYVIRKHTQLAGIYGEATNAVLAARLGFEKQAGVAEQTLEANGPYILGNTFTGADILLVTCLGWAERLGVPLTATLRGYFERATARPAYRLGHSANQQ